MFLNSLNKAVLGGSQANCFGSWIYWSSGGEMVKSRVHGCM